MEMFIFGWLIMLSVLHEMRALDVETTKGDLKEDSHAQSARTKRQRYPDYFDYMHYMLEQQARTAQEHLMPIMPEAPYNPYDLFVYPYGMQQPPRAEIFAQNMATPNLYNNGQQQVFLPSIGIHPTIKSLCRNSPSTCFSSNRDQVKPKPRYKGQQKTGSGTRTHGKSGKRKQSQISNENVTKSSTCLTNISAANQQQNQNSSQVVVVNLNGNNCTCSTSATKSDSTKSSASGDSKLSSIPQPKQVESTSTAATLENKPDTLQASLDTEDKEANLKTVQVKLASSENSSSTKNENVFKDQTKPVVVSQDPDDNKTLNITEFQIRIEKLIAMDLEDSKEQPKESLKINTSDLKTPEQQQDSKSKSVEENVQAFRSQDSISNVSSKEENSKLFNNTNQDDFKSKVAFKFKNVNEFGNNTELKTGLEDREIVKQGEQEKSLSSKLEAAALMETLKAPVIIDQNSTEILNTKIANQTKDSNETTLKVDQVQVREPVADQGIENKSKAFEPLEGEELRLIEAKIRKILEDYAKETNETKRIANHKTSNGSNDEASFKAITDPIFHVEHWNETTDIVAITGSPPINLNNTNTKTLEEVTRKLQELVKEFNSKRNMETFIINSRITEDADTKNKADVTETLDSKLKALGKNRNQQIFRVPIQGNGQFELIQFTQGSGMSVANIFNLDSFKMSRESNENQVEAPETHTKIANKEGKQTSINLKEKQDKEATLKETDSKSNNQNLSDAEIATTLEETHSKTNEQNLFSSKIATTSKEKDSKFIKLNLSDSQKAATLEQTDSKSNKQSLSDAVLAATLEETHSKSNEQSLSEAEIAATLKEIDSKFTKLNLSDSQIEQTDSKSNAKNLSDSEEKVQEAITNSKFQQQQSNTMTFVLESSEKDEQTSMPIADKNSNQTPSKASQTDINSPKKEADNNTENFENNQQIPQSNFKQQQQRVLIFVLESSDNDEDTSKLSNSNQHASKPVQSNISSKIEEENTSSDLKNHQQIAIEIMPDSNAKIEPPALALTSINVPEVSKSSVAKLDSSSVPKDRQSSSANQKVAVEILSNSNKDQSQAEVASTAKIQQKDSEAGNNRQKAQAVISNSDSSSQQSHSNSSFEKIQETTTISKSSSNRRAEKSNSQSSFEAASKVFSSDFDSSQTKFSVTNKEAVNSPHDIESVNPSNFQREEQINHKQPYKNLPNSSSVPNGSDKKPLDSVEKSNSRSELNDGETANKSNSQSEFNLEQVFSKSSSSDSKSNQRILIYTITAQEALEDSDLRRDEQVNNKEQSEDLPTSYSQPNRSDEKLFASAENSNSQSAINRDEVVSTSFSSDFRQGEQQSGESLPNSSSQPNRSNEKIIVSAEKSDLTRDEVVLELPSSDSRSSQGKLTIIVQERDEHFNNKQPSDSLPNSSSKPNKSDENLTASAEKSDSQSELTGDEVVSKSLSSNFRREEHINHKQPIENSPNSSSKPNRSNEKLLELKEKSQSELTRELVVTKSLSLDSKNSQDRLTITAQEAPKDSGFRRGERINNEQPSESLPNSFSQPERSDEQLLGSAEKSELTRKQVVSKSLSSDSKNSQRIFIITAQEALNNHQTKESLLNSDLSSRKSAGETDLERNQQVNSFEENPESPVNNRKGFQTSNSKSDVNQGELKLESSPTLQAKAVPDSINISKDNLRFATFSKEETPNRTNHFNRQESNGATTSSINSKKSQEVSQTIPSNDENTSKSSNNLGASVKQGNLEEARNRQEPASSEDKQNLKGVTHNTNSPPRADRGHVIQFTFSANSQQEVDANPSQQSNLDSEQNQQTAEKSNVETNRKPAWKPKIIQENLDDLDSNSELEQKQKHVRIYSFSDGKGFIRLNFNANDKPKVESISNNNGRQQGANKPKTRAGDKSHTPSISQSFSRTLTDLESNGEAEVKSSLFSKQNRPGSQGGSSITSDKEKEVHQPSIALVNQEGSIKSFSDSPANKPIRTSARNNQRNSDSNFNRGRERQTFALPNNNEKGSFRLMPEANEKQQSFGNAGANHKTIQDAEHETISEADIESFLEFAQQNSPKSDETNFRRNRHHSPRYISRFENEDFGDPDFTLETGKVKSDDMTGRGNRFLNPRQRNPDKVDEPTVSEIYPGSRVTSQRPPSIYWHRIEERKAARPADIRTLKELRPFVSSEFVNVNDDSENLEDLWDFYDEESEEETKKPFTNKPFKSSNRHK